MTKHLVVGKANVVDRLSDLPDALIHHIFSFLDMRIVVQTSTLAIRWRNLWTSTPYLNFNFTLSDTRYHYLFEKEKRKCFMKFVNRVLICRDALNVQKFGLSSQSPLDVDHLHTWLIGVLKRNVEELYLQLCVDQPFELPPRVFTSEITILTLSRYGRGDIQLPDSIFSAPKLRSLKLENVKLPDGNSDGELILSCPALENLSMVMCSDNHLEDFTVAAIALKTFEFNSKPDHDSLCIMNICCPNLTSISYTCYGNPYLSLVDLPALVSAYIEIGGYNIRRKGSYSDRLISVLRGIQNIRSLQLGEYTLRDLIDSPSIFKMLPRIFTNLRHITVDDYYEENGRDVICAMAEILKIFPLKLGLSTAKIDAVLIQDSYRFRAYYIDEE